MRNISQFSIMQHSGSVSEPTIAEKTIIVTQINRYPHRTLPSFIYQSSAWLIIAKSQKIPRVRDTYTHLAIWTNAQIKPSLEDLF